MKQSESFANPPADLRWRFPCWRHPFRSGFSRSAFAAVCLLWLTAGSLSHPAGAQLDVPGAPPVELRPSDPAAGDLFGCALSVDGSEVAVGSVYDDDRGSGSGSVYVFAAAGQGQETKLLAADGAAGDTLGFSVGISGDRVVAGAPNRAEVGQLSGAVYAFRRDQGQWSQEAKLVPPSLGPRDELGRAVAIDGSLVAAGAPGDDDRGSSAGAVYVYDLDAGTAAPPAKVLAADGAVGDGLGFALALDGSRLLAGAPFADPRGLQSGAAYVFERQAGAWVQVARLVPSDGTAGALFGGSIALAGNRAVIGARLEDAALDGGSVANAGAVYVFERQGGAWVEVAKLTAPDLMAGDELGISVALSGTMDEGRILAGARFAASGGAARAGAAYLFEGAGAAWEATLRLAADSPSPGDELGFAVGLGSLDDQGDQDLYAGTYRDDGAGLDAGSVYTYRRGDDGSDGGDGGDDGGGTGGSNTADLTVDLEGSASSSAPAVAGGMTTYTLTATNLGPTGVSSALVTLSAPPSSLTCTFACTAQAGGGCGAPSGSLPLADTANLPAGASTIYAIDCAIDPAAPSSLSLIAAISAPDGTPDPVVANNEDSVTTPVIRRANVGVTKTATPSTVCPGDDLEYRVTVSHRAGSGTARVTLEDILPPNLACSWGCSASGGAACPAATGTGDLLEDLVLPPASQVLYSLACEVLDSAADMLVNIAELIPAEGFEDTDPGDQTAVATTPVVCEADFQVTKTAEPAEVAVGDTLAYTITVTNLGPEPAEALVSDMQPPGLVCSWQCSATGGGSCTLPGGTGGLLDSVFLPLGAVATYSLPCEVVDAPPGELVNTAEATTPPGVQDPNLANNSASATVTVTAVTADLSLVKSDNQDSAVQGGLVAYTLVISNAGPGDAEGITVMDLIPANLVGVSWNCGGLVGSGDLVATVDVPAGGSVVCTLSGTTPETFCGDLVNTATLELPATLRDPDFEDWTDEDQTLIVPAPGAGGTSNLCASKALLTGPHAPGSLVSYRIRLFNGGPDPLMDGLGNEFEDVLPPELGGASVSADGGVAVILPGNLLIWNGAIPADGVVTLTVQATLLNNVPPGTVVSNQGFLVNTPTDNPDTPDPQDPTVFVVATIVEIPTLGAVGLALLVGILAWAGLVALRRRRA
ncbi:MAG: IPTL-CTERM sorting domain-containing protein [Acidobacteriota bacterium]|nr:IPTL-CTERM sorting domain-containing protein [Acidobacteriota bacterium]